MYLNVSKIFTVVGTCLLLTASLASTGEKFARVELIEKSQADYKSPENTLAAFLSAAVNDDLEWWYQSLTEKTQQSKVELAEKAGVSREHEIATIRKTLLEAFIRQKVPHKNGFILVTEVRTKNRDSHILPYTFVQENGLWKFTNEFKADTKLLNYLDYIPADK